MDAAAQAYYNLAITGLSVTICLFIGQIEEKWTARLQRGTPGGMVREPPTGEGGEPLASHSVYNDPGGARPWNTSSA